MTPKGQNPKQKRIRNDTAIEALRDLGGGTVKTLGEDFLNQIPEDIFTQTGFKPRKTFTPSIPPEGVSFEERESLLRRLRRQEIVRREEKIVFTAKHQETKTQIATLQQELKNLVSATQNLAQEVKIAASQTPVEPGTYHVSFLEKLISFVRSLAQKIENASLWAATWNARTKKQPFYWAQVRKSGTKFMLSQERYMATQAG